jgi:hypothetical protein
MSIKTILHGIIFSYEAKNNNLFKQQFILHMIEDIIILHMIEVLYENIIVEYSY